MKFNDLNLTDWKNLEIDVNSLWIINERDKSGKHKNIYHGNFIPQIPRQLIRRFTNENDTVLDVFLESWTTLYECETLKRNFIGLDINPKMMDYVNSQMADMYGAYLKLIKKSAQKELILEPALFQINDNEHEVFNEDSNQLIKKIAGDILYLDPPYNARQYGSNYHLLNTIAKYDTFLPKGKTGLREYNRSNYCSKSNVKKSFEDLIKNANFEYTFLSYNNEGLIVRRN